MADIAERTQDFGANSWLVEEMYEQFRTDPSSVSEAWREFFSDYKSLLGNGAPVAASAAPAPAPAPAAPKAESNGSAPAPAPVAAAPAPATFLSPR